MTPALYTATSGHFNEAGDNDMPYAIRYRAKGDNGIVRRGTVVWLQEDSGGPHSAHVKVIGLSTGRKMVAFWTDPADLQNIQYCWLADDSHTRMKWAAKDDVTAYLDDFNLRATTHVNQREKSTI